MGYNTQKDIQLSVTEKMVDFYLTVGAQNHVKRWWIRTKMFPFLPFWVIYYNAAAMWACEPCGS